MTDLNVTALVGLERTSGERHAAEVLKKGLGFKLLQTHSIIGDGDAIKSSDEMYYPTGNIIDALEVLDTDVVFISTMGNFIQELDEMTKRWPVVLQMGQNYTEFMLTPNARNDIGGLFHMLNNVDAIVCPSPYVQDVMGSLGFKNTTHIPGPIDKSQYKIADGNSTDILMCGRIEIIKNFLTPIFAITDLMKEDINIGLGIFGNGSMKQFYKNVVNTLGLQRNVRFYNYTDLSDVYSQARMYVQPSISENMSRTVVEAMASGVPTITSDVGGCKLSDAILTARHDNPKEFYEAMKLLLNDDVWQEKHEQVLKDAEKHDISNIKDDYSKLFENLVENKRGLNG